MSEDIIFRGALATAGVLLIVIRVFYALKAGKSPGKPALKREGKVGILLLVFSLGMLASSIYVVAPSWMSWSDLPLPVWLRWSGLPLSGVSVLFFLWVHRVLGKNWSLSLVVKDQHTLVTGGPYRWVRHPMYTNAFNWTLVFFLLSANWFIGVAWLLLSILSALRAGEEEAMLIERFGDEYRLYMRRTGRFLPRLSR